MASPLYPSFAKLAVVGAGNMGAGIAQKMASEGFPVVLVDLDEDKVRRGVQAIESTLDEGVVRKVFSPEQAAGIVSRIHGTSDWSALAEADLVVEAVFEDLDVKRQVFARLEQVCRPDALLATNTSSFSVTELARSAARPERILGLHYFYHPAKNRLVEVVPGQATDPARLRAAWSLQERLGKTPIRSADAHGFVVNRFFVPWLNEAARLLEEEVASAATIEAACKKTFGTAMGPFELMNVTGPAIALHAATTLGQAYGPFYAPAERLRRQVEAGGPWPLEGPPDERAFDAVADRMLGVVFLVAGALAGEGVGSIEDTDIGARVGLRWPLGPFELMNRHGLERSARLVGEVARRFDLPLPELLARRFAERKPFTFQLVRSEVGHGVATLTIHRPDAMNALNETVVAQLHDALRRAAADPAVRGIVITGAGKAFVAGADIGFFVENIEAGNLERIVSFTRAGHALLDDIAACAKPVIARVDGIALGGGVELALACERIVASPRAVFAFPETGIGIYPGLGGTQRLPRRIGPGLAKWLIYTGETLSAERAYEVGLADRVVRHEELDDTIRQLLTHEAPASSPTWPIAFAELERLFRDSRVEDVRLARVDPAGREHLLKAIKRVATKAPLALRLAEKLIDEGGKLDLAAGLRLELEHLLEIFGTADAREGLSSVGRKKPEFQGR